MDAVSSPTVVIRTTRASSDLALRSDSSARSPSAIWLRSAAFACRRESSGCFRLETSQVVKIWHPRKVRLKGKSRLVIANDLSGGMK
jgi:hypothetical protein